MNLLEKIQKDKRAYEKSERELARQSNRLESMISKSTKNSLVNVTGGFILPVNGARISSPFGWRTHPIFKSKIFHTGIDYAIAMEGSLKLKEISYIHSEAYAAGELKHGTISLIEDGTLVGAVCTQDSIYAKTVSNMVECKTRGAFILAVTTVGHEDIEDVADYVIYVPQTNKYFTNSLAIIPLQLFGYYVSVGKGYDVDHPRNLAKSVTVE